MLTRFPVFASSTVPEDVRVVRLLRYAGGVLLRHADLSVWA